MKEVRATEHKKNKTRCSGVPTDVRENISVALNIPERSSSGEDTEGGEGSGGGGG